MGQHRALALVVGGDGGGQVVAGALQGAQDGYSGGDVVLGVQQVQFPSDQLPGPHTGGGDDLHGAHRVGGGDGPGIESGFLVGHRQGQRGVDIHLCGSLADHLLHVLPPGHVHRQQGVLVLVRRRHHVLGIGVVQERTRDAVAWTDA